MLDDKTLTTVRTVSVMQRQFPEMASKLKQNPTSFITEVFNASGIQVPEGFHAHTVRKGEGLPEEPHRGTKDRDVYFFPLDGDMEHHLIEGSPSGDDAGLMELNDCCKCGFNCCVVETDDK